MRGCPYCGSDQLDVTIGVVVFEYKYGLPHQQVAADRTVCKQCGWRKLGGFAKEPGTVAGDDGWQQEWQRSMATLMARAPGLIERVDETWGHATDADDREFLFKIPISDDQ